MSIYYQDDQVTLYHGDCREVMAGLPPESQHVIVTSPPYNMGVSPGGNGRGLYKTSKSSKGKRFHEGYDQHGDDMDPDKYAEWQRGCLRDMWRVTSSDGAIYYNHKPRVIHGKALLPLSMDFPVPLRQVIIWDRGTGIGVSARHYSSTAEWVMLFAKEDFKLRNHSASGSGDVWRIGMAIDKFNHPAPFPVELPAKAIYTSGARSVFDPFCGSGTTLVAARLAGIKGVGVESSERYCEIIANRLAQGVLDFGGAA